MDEFVQLNRTFIDFDSSSIDELDDQTFALRSFYRTEKTWVDILKNRCTVILAEAGTGKTMELRAQATQLRRSKDAAFFCNLEILADNTFAQAIEIGTTAELDAWMQGTSEAYFFLDAVDEARLSNPKDFDRAIVRLADTIEPYASRATIVISTRPHAWQAQADPAMLSRRMSLPATTETAGLDVQTSDKKNPFGVLEADNQQRVSRINEPSIAIVQLAPLTAEQVRTFAIAKGVTNVDDFMKAIEHAEADVFASRPADLPSLIYDWNENKPFGRYSEVVARNVKLKLSEENPHHEKKSPIAEGRAHQGAESLAAAVTLAKHTSIILPDEPLEPALRDKSLDPKQVLEGWTPNEVHALLSRALFDEALYGTVRFHHRTAREYLAARWFERLLKKQKNRRSVEHIFFAKPYGTEPEVVVPSLKAVVAWLAVWDQRIRDRLLRVDPKVLLEYGDISALDIGTREALLREFARRYGNRSHTPISLHLREVRRLSDQRLAGTICDLLEKYRSHVDVSQLLLRIVREGNVAGCGSTVLTFVTDENADAYTRSIAVQAIGNAGTVAEKKSLASTVISSASTLDGRIISAAVETLWPDVLSDDDVIKLLEATPAPKQFSSSMLDMEILRLVDGLRDKGRLCDWLKALVSLLSRPPLSNDEYARISVRYDWLLPLLWQVMKKLSSLLERPEAVNDFLSGLTMCVQASNLKRYAGGVEADAAQLIENNASIRRALFWHECVQARCRTGNPLTDWLSAVRGTSVSFFNEADSEAYLQDLHERAQLDDKLVALSVLVTLFYRSGEKPKLLDRIKDATQTVFDRSGRKPKLLDRIKDAIQTIFDHAGPKSKLLDRIKDAIQGDAALEAALTEHLTPRQPSPSQLESEARLRESKSKRDKKREEAEQGRRQWISNLREKPDQIGDLTIATEGKVWRNTVWLVEEIRKKQDAGGSWTQSRWESLEPDFGSEVAENFRDFCLQFWRRYTPQLRSEAGGDSQTIPWAVIVGLSGLAMEARMSADWATTLNDSEAELATRYALLELNQFPDWLWALYRAHPSPVTRILLREAEWEFDTPRPDGVSGYVLSRLRWTAEKLDQALRNDLIQILESRPRADITPLTEALTVILRDPSPVMETFRDAVVRHSEAATSEAPKAVWLSALLCLDADRAIGAIERWVNEGTDTDAKERRISLILNHVWGDEHSSLNSHHRDFMKAHVLHRMLKLAHSYIRIEDDISHDEGYSPGVRDHAQEARGHLLELLVGIPGRPTFDALADLSNFHSLEYPKNRMLNLAEQRAEADVDLSEWQTKDVAAFGRETERDPKTQKDLFDIALSRLDDIKLDLEEGDESEASLWRKVHDEIELRRVVANRLKLIAQNKYTTGSEEELADRARTDIRLHHPDVDFPIPIEIKIAGRWSGNEHRERLENQLIGQYMREAHYGIFLIINRGGDSDHMSWRPGNKKLLFLDLIEWLVDEACELCKTHDHIQGLTVIGIDLLIRDKKTGKRKS